LRYLIEGALASSGVIEDSNNIDIIKNFLVSWTKKLPAPSLRMTTAFLLEIGQQLIQITPDDLEGYGEIALAIGRALPVLDLFRSQELVRKIDKNNGGLKEDGLRLLAEIADAARVGAQPLENEEIRAFERSINEKIKDKNLATKLKKFIGQGYRSEGRSALEYDWEEVKEVFGKRKKASQIDKAKELAKELKNAIGIPVDNEDYTDQDIPDYIKDVIQALDGGEKPEYDEVEQFIEATPGLAKKPKQKLRKEANTIIEKKGVDFLTVFAQLAVELLNKAHKSDEYKPGETALKIKVTAEKIKKEKPETFVAALAFRTLFGGVENFMPFVEWDLSQVWDKAKQAEQELKEESPDEEQEGEALDDETTTPQFTTAKSKSQSLETSLLSFKVEITGIKSDGKIFWVYDADNAVVSLANAINNSSLGVYSYEAAYSNREFPLNTPGRWYNKPFVRNIRAELEKSFNLYNISPSSKSSLLNLVDELDSAYKLLGQKAKQEGLLACNNEFATAFQKFEQFLQTALQYFKSDKSKQIGFPLINKAWMIRNESQNLDWAVVTPLHPLKLMVYYNRARYFASCLQTLLNPIKAKDALASYKIFWRELASIASGAGCPAVLSLTSSHSEVKYYVPVDENAGFELYQPYDQISSESGLGRAIDSGEDDRAVIILARVVEDFLETYPFTQQGLQLTVTNCSNGTLPITLIEQVRKGRKPGDQDLAINLLAHTPNNGSIVYQDLSQWLEDSEISQERLEGTYIPRVTISVVERETRQLGFALNDCTNGLVVLANTFVANAKLEAKSRKLPNMQATDWQQFLPSYQVRPRVAERESLSREFELNQPNDPQIVRNFYLCQFLAVKSDDTVEETQFAAFSRKIRLDDWKNTLLELHHRFNWVICYDTNVDRNLLQNVCNEAEVSIIRYSTGLGPKRQHSLTVSSSTAARESVRQRLLTKISSLIPNLAEEKRQSLAQWLVIEAQAISGDLVLRATGPGALVNELMGVVLAKYAMSRSSVKSSDRNETQAAHLWISADEYRHWFEQSGSTGRSRPDLIGLELSILEGKLHLKVQVVEAKYLSGANSSSYSKEATDAIGQVKAGLATLKPAWTPGNYFLDSPYWYDQLYRAIASQLELKPEQEEIKEKLVDLYAGNFTCEVEGYACIFTYQQAPYELDNSSMRITQEEADEDLESFGEDNPVKLWTHEFSPAWLTATISDILQIENLNEFTLDSSEHECSNYESERQILMENKIEFDRIISELSDVEVLDWSELISQSASMSEATILSEDSEDVELISQTEQESDSEREPEQSGQVQENLEETQPPTTNETENIVPSLHIQPTTLPSALSQPEQSKKVILEEAPKLWTPPGVLPHIQFLKLLNDYQVSGKDDEIGTKQAVEAKLEVERIFKARNVRASIAGSVLGPRVIRVKVSPQLSIRDYNGKILKMGDLFKQRLGLPTEPQIQTGSDKTIWIDMARKAPVTIGLKSLLIHSTMNELKSESRFPVGVTLEGEIEFGDLRKTAHWLVGGTSGSGKSIFIRSILLSLLYNNNPNTLQFVLIDPKSDMAIFQKLPFTTQYLSTEELDVVPEILQSITEQMQNRIGTMKKKHFTNEIDVYHKAEGTTVFPRIVIVIEEYATLLDSVSKAAKEEIEQQVRRISAIGRSSGFHLFVCTQNPLAKDLGSSLKANLSGRVALKVLSNDNSMVILDEVGAEKLLKNGDMLYKTEDGETKRLQAPFVNEDELRNLIKLLENSSK
jgi:DNA segregation ATPase FtsK/SpoIIIE-like protein